MKSGLFYFAEKCCLAEGTNLDFSAIHLSAVPLSDGWLKTCHG